MRIRLILQDHAGIDKRKLWFLFDESKCAKVSDVSYLIKKQFFTGEKRVSLSLDGFELPSQEKISIIRDGDTITVQIHVNTIKPTPSSSSESEDFTKKSTFVKKTQSNSSNLGKVSLVKRTTISKKPSSAHPSNVLKKVAATLPHTNALNKVKLNQAAASVLTKDGPAKKVSTGLAKLNNTQTKSESSSSSASSSSSDDQTKTTKKKVLPANPVRKSESKTLPLSKLSFSKKVSSSESSTEDDQPSEKKTYKVSKKKENVSSSKKVTSSKGKNDSGDSVDSSSSSSDEEMPVIRKSTLMNNRAELKNNAKPVTVNKTKNNVPANKQLTNKQAQKSSEDSSDSSSSSASSNADISKTKQKNTKVDFQVSNQSKNKTATNLNDMTANNSNNLNNSKAKLQISKDVYKNKSQFLVSKTSTPIATNTSNGSKLSSLDVHNISTQENGRLNNQNLNIKEISNGYDFKENLNDSFTPKKECVSGKTLRRRRRNQMLKERRNKNSFAKGEKVEISGSSVNGASVDILETTASTYIDCNNTPTDQDTSFRTLHSGNGDQNGIEMPTTNIDSINNGDKICDNVYNGVPSLHPLKDYSSCEKLTAPPGIGSILGYKILEMCTDTYTPEISNYKEACVKSYDKESSILELELLKDSQMKRDNDKIGKFEMPDLSDIVNNQEVEEKNILVKWSELIDPCLIV